MTKKITLITGGSKGIGLATARRFTSLGYQVVTYARNPVTWDAAIQSHPELSSVDFQQVDVSDEEQVQQFFEYIKTHYEQLDIAVNNASPALVSQGVFSALSPSCLKNTLLQDFWSHAQCLRYQLKCMHSGSVIVNVSSVNGFRPTPGAAMYSAAKHALEGLTRSVALEAIEQGIRVNAVAPGVTWTPRWEERQRKMPDIRDTVEAIVPMKRFANADEVVNAIEWLCSEQSSYVVGHTLVVDGGLSLK